MDIQKTIPTWNTISCCPSQARQRRGSSVLLLHHHQHCHHWTEELAAPEIQPVPLPTSKKIVFWHAVWAKCINFCIPSKCWGLQELQRGHWKGTCQCYQADKIFLALSGQPDKFIAMLMARYRVKKERVFFQIGSENITYVSLSSSEFNVDCLWISGHIALLFQWHLTLLCHFCRANTILASPAKHALLFCCSCTNSVPWQLKWRVCAISYFFLASVKMCRRK